jgi:hypothetical protein
VTHDIGPNYTARDELGKPVEEGGLTPSQWKIGGAFSGMRGFADGVGIATWASRSASSIAPLMLSITWKLWVLRRFPSTVERVGRATRSTGARPV